MNKVTTQSYTGMNQDISKSKYNEAYVNGQKTSNGFYFEGRNIRIVATDSQTTGSVTNEKGNKLILSIPSPVIDYTNKIISWTGMTNPSGLSYTTDEINKQLQSKTINQSGVQQIIGHSNSREDIILLTTDNNGFDCIWKIEIFTDQLQLLYIRDLGFSTDNPLQVLDNFENEKIDKLYWVDGINQMRSLNLNHSIKNDDLEELIDLPYSIINMVGKYNITEPEIIDVIKGGTHTAGRIQYAYNLYRLNALQTKTSPLSRMISLTKGAGAGGGNVNEVVSAIPVIRISGIDQNYTHIKVYAIKYTSYNGAPSITVISDSYIPQSGTLDIFDDGTNISSVSLEEFLFLGSDVIIPQHINSKFNRLFFANYKEVNFEVKLDFRAYAFSNINRCFVHSNIYYDPITDNVAVNPSDTIEINPTAFTDDPDDTFDSINLDYDAYKFHADGITHGGEGKYIKYELVQDSIVDNTAQYFKDSEIYRLGIQFYNGYGQISSPTWIADFKSLDGNLDDHYNKLKITLKPDFYVWLNDSTNFKADYQKPVGYKMLIAQRNITDRTIAASGLIGTMVINDKSGKQTADYDYKIRTSKGQPKIPTVLLRNCREYTASPTYTERIGTSGPISQAVHLSDPYNDSYAGQSPSNEYQLAYRFDVDTRGRFWQYNTMMQMYSPELLFEFTNSLAGNYRFRIKGGIKNSTNNMWGRTYITTNTTAGVYEGKVWGGLTYHYRNSGYIENIRSESGGRGMYDVTSSGIIAHPLGREPNYVSTMLFNRVYGPLGLSNTIDSIGPVYTFVNNFFCTNATNKIQFTDANQIISIKLNDSLVTTTDSFESYIRYTITPYTAGTYDVYIVNEAAGINEKVSYTGLVGIQNITFTSDSFTPVSDISSQTRTDTYGLIIKSDVFFDGKIDVLARSINTTTSIIDEHCSSTFNLITIDPTTIVEPIGFYYEPSTNNLNWEVYGSPVVTDKGQSFTTYNSDSDFRFVNNMKSVLTDLDTDWQFGGSRAITSVNAYNTRCATFVLGAQPWLSPMPNPVEPENRLTLDQVFDFTGITGDNWGAIGEFVKSNAEIYLGNIYGGNSYEAKRRTNYIEIGSYKDLSLTTLTNSQNDTYYINSPGDTYVQKFKFLRITRYDAAIESVEVKEYEELIEVPVETTVDLSARSDKSLESWDSMFVYLDSEYHNYNKVYSQQSDLLIRRSTNFNFKKVDKFDTTIIVSKVKVNGEIIDSWTDILLNEKMVVDGKYGSINSLHNYKDELYSLQDSAVAVISVLPRVQVQGSDGIAVELGVGNVLQRYTYLTTQQGCRNKWSVVNSPDSFYFYDVTNNNLNICKGNQIAELSDLKGLHTYFVNNINKTDILTNNPVIKKGIATGYDYLNDEVYFTFLQGNKSFTVNYCEDTQSFVSFYDYIPTRYISRGNEFFAIDQSNNKIYKQYAGDYNVFFDNPTPYPSYIILDVNPEPMFDCVFDNINFKSEVYAKDLSGKYTIDQPDKTLTGIRAYNDYQDSNTPTTVTPLIVGRNNNLRRKFRDWNALIPRDGRERVRAPWIKLKLEFQNPNNYRLVLHDTNIYYTI
jgi:hypothetical protein